MKNFKRTELHLHTNLSDDISIIGVEQIFSVAQELGLDAVAFTNLSNVRDFPKIARYHKRNPELKVMYGAVVFYEADDETERHKLTLIAKNQAGIKGLYKVISSIKKDGVYSLIDLEVLKQNRMNLLVGSCGNSGELYKAVVNDKDAQKIADFYDYFEIYPSNDETEKTIYKKIYELGEKLGVPVVASGNCHYISSKDALCRKIVMRVAHGIEDDDNGELYIRTTEEMLEEFSYLGNCGADKVVLENPKNIANLVEKVAPVKECRYSPVFENAVLDLQEICYNKAYEIYGNPLPETVEKRLSDEFSELWCDDFATQYLIAKKLVDYAKEKGQLVTARGSVGSVLLAFLLGICESNPLPPHYYCSHCHYFEEVKDIADGFDLPNKNCPICNKPLKSDGHNIPYEMFMGHNGRKMPDIDLNFPEEFELEIQHFMRILFGETKTAQAGVIHTVNKRIAESYINKYESIEKLDFSAEEREELISKLIGIKCSCGVHPTGIITVPEGMDFEDFTPVDNYWAPQSATHFDFHDLNNTILKQDIMCFKALDLLLDLENKTGKSSGDIQWNDPLIYEMFQKADTLGIPEFDTDFVRELIAKIKPKNFNDLVKISGLCHGTNVWIDNGEFLVENGVPVSKIPCFRDDIMNDLLMVGGNRNFAYLCSENARMGLFAKGRAQAQLVEEFKEISSLLDEWYFDYCNKIKYMFPKAHAVIYVMVAIRCAWFKIYYPAEFYTAYLSYYFDGDEPMTQEEALQFEKLLKECSKKGIKLAQADIDKLKNRKNKSEN